MLRSSLLPIPLLAFITLTSQNLIETNKLPENNSQQIHQLSCKHVFEFFDHFSSGDYSTLNCVMGKINVHNTENLKECRNYRTLPFNESILARLYNPAFDAIFINNRLCQHNFDKIFADYFENMRKFYRGSVRKYKLSCYLKKLKQIKSQASYSDEFLSKNCKSVFEEIEIFFIETRSQITEDLHEDNIFHCVGDALIDEKVYDKFQFKIMGNYEYTNEELVELRTKHLGRYRRFEERKAECLLKHFYHQFVEQD